ncbi:MAG: 2-C-methyl-D-erythritol 4-phosphate cytidylyltransferase [Clostridiales bacterium]|nr:2-C-methyl-D-erythritol 4-phosphate cytidylyltransferase [Clostridiales bacterium]
MENRKTEKKHTAIVLAAGKGSRMHSETPKQFLELEGRPLVCYALQAFQESFIDEIILVTGEGQEDYCREEIVKRHGFTKVKQVIAGGKERYDSVYRGLCAADPCDYVYIQDGARPFLDEALLLRAKACVEESGACAAGMPVKDTIKTVDANGVVRATPDRRFLWQIQTPQVFSFPIIMEAYSRMFAAGECEGITDDAMVAERFSPVAVRLFEGSDRNIKITTPSDLLVAKILAENKF